MLPSESDRDLLRACLEGDPQAWIRLIQRYDGLVRRITRRWDLSEEDADDVLQTVHLRLVENLRHLRRHESLGAWITATATHEAWRLLRQRRRITPLTLEPQDATDLAEMLPAIEPLPSEILIRLEEEEMVRQAIQQLGGRCRELLELLYYADPAPSYAEIGQRLGMPQGSIGPTRARCLHRLGKILKEMGF